MIQQQQMTRAIRVAAVGFAVLVAVSAIGGVAFAQSGPPQPPHRVYGTVADSADDTLSEATVEIVYDGDVVTTTSADTNGEYDVQVEDPDPDAQNEELTVRVPDLDASQTLTYGSGETSEVNFNEGTADPGTTPTETPRRGGGGGGGGGGSGTPDSPSTLPDDAERTVVEIDDTDPDTPGVDVRITSASVIEGITFSNESAEGVVTVWGANELSDDAPGLPEGYLTVSSSDVTVPAVLSDESATIRMTIDQERLEELGIEEPNLAVFRLPDDGNSWEELDVEVLDEDADGVTIEVETPGFSTFAVAQQQAEQTPTTTPTETATETATETDEGPSGDDGLPWVPIVIGVVLVAIIVAGWYYFAQRE